MAFTVQDLHKHAYDTISPTQEANSARGTTVLVTGASANLGFELAKSFALASAEHVILHGRDGSALEAAVGRLKAESSSSKTKISIELADLSDAKSISAMWERLAAANVHVDTLVLSAATNDTSPDILDVDSLVTGMETNFINQIRCALHFLKQSPSSGRRKTLIAVSSGALHMYPYPRSAVYPVVKLALSGYLTRMADKIPESECRIVSVHPGTVKNAAMIKLGIDPVKMGLPVNDADLPANFCVWLAGNADASILHGTFVWSTWDADQLISLKRSKADDKGFLRVGLQGVETADSTTIFDQIRTHKEYKS